MYAVTVTFQIKPGQMDAFLRLVTQNARASVTQEPACSQFDVCHTPGEDTVFLYEIYDDRAGFEAHLGTAHFRSFDAVVADMVSGKDVHLFKEVVR